MSAQVEGLRRFIGTRGATPWKPSAQAVVVVAGATGGAGGSVVASLLALAVAQGARRTLLVDSDEAIGSLHHLLDVTVTRGISALRDPSVSVDDCLVHVGTHCELIAGGHAAPHAVPFDTTARRTVMRRLAQRYHEFDAVIIDAGSRLDGILAATEPGFSRLLVVAGVSPVSIASAYAIVKTTDARWREAAVELLFNRSTPDAGRSAFEQVRTAAGQFLRRDVGFVGALPTDAALAAVPEVPLVRCSRAVELAMQELAGALFPDASLASLP